MQLRLSTRANSAALLSLAMLAAVHAQTLRSEQAVAAPSPADEAVIPEVDEPVALAQREVFGMALAALVIFVAAGGGTGGGGVLDPIYILIMGFSAKVRLSSGWSLTLQTTTNLVTLNNVLNAADRHPSFQHHDSRRSVTGTRTLQKAISARQKERWQCGVSPESTALLGIDSSTSDPAKARARSATEVELRADVPWRQLATLLSLFVVIAGMRVLRGGQNFASPVGIDSSSALYPVLVALPYVFLVGISYFSLKNLSATYEQQQSPGYEFEAHEIKVKRTCSPSL
ncbi:unnamed protein product [Phytophthora lilii]|uniref:Unnamed protein product n=1 Tax=Phytophthora lilii TaxID=2077276 RepID=A0A9W6TT92_9STRA|nr:unnamed protein product [Phytophthora lilii]